VLPSGMALYQQRGFSMNASVATIGSSTKDVGRIRFGGGWRLPPAKPNR